MELVAQEGDPTVWPCPRLLRKHRAHFLLEPQSRDTGYDVVDLVTLQNMQSQTRYIRAGSSAHHLRLLTVVIRNKDVQVQLRSRMLRTASELRNKVERERQ